MFLKFIKIAITFCLFFIFLNITTANAQTNFKPQIGIGGEFTKGANVNVTNNTQTIAEYIKQIYKYLIGIVAIVAVVVMMLGGIIWITAGGNPSRVGEAKSWITASLTGLILVMFSYVILKTVNPELVNFKVQTITPIKLDSSSSTTGGCCRDTTDMGGYYLCAEVKSSSDCDLTMDSHEYTDGATCITVKGCKQYGSVGCCRDTTDMGGYYLCAEVKSSSDCGTKHEYTDGSCSTVPGCRPYPGG